MQRRGKADTGQLQARGPKIPRAEPFGREVARLHQQIYRHNQARINSSVTGYTAAFRKYERDYLRQVRHFERRASIHELVGKMAQAQVVFVGDYHTLPRAQRSFLELLRHLPPERPVTVAVEFVRGRHQKALNAYMAKKSDEDALLVAIKNQSHWLFGGWKVFRDILELAQQRGYGVIGIDSLGRNTGGSSLQARDNYAAKRIVAALGRQPSGLVMVLTGELHIAPSHLPRQVCAQAALRGATPQYVLVYQNCEPIYANLQKRGLENDTAVVKIAPGEYCLINTPPIVCQQSFLNWLHRDEEGSTIDEPEQTFKDYVKRIATFFDLPVGDALDDVELTTMVDLSFLNRLRRRGDFSRHDVQTIRRQILAAESYYIPRASIVYLGNLSANHVAEEATHFLRHVCGDLQDPKLLVDAFYARCIEEAVGFMGSKIINHQRKSPDRTLLEKMRRSRKSLPHERELARLVLLHVRMEAGERVRGLARAYESEAGLFNQLTHALGYRLGDKLYNGLAQGQLQKSEVRELFFDTFEEEGAALTSYLYLMKRTALVRLPKTF